MKSNRFFFTLSCLIITIIILCCFGRTITSYFLEDDLGEVLYAHQIFSGHWQQIISNFTGNYMGIATMKVYRPCLLLSIMADYAIWKTNAAGYFATNIAFLIATALTLYMVLIELTRSWSRPRSTLFAFFSAALFASSPLHCESVSLMVGRVDIICAFFYLLALWSFVRKGDRKNWLLSILTVLSFWIALLTKEMAIGLPVLLTILCFLFPDVLIKKSKESGIYTNDDVKPNTKQRLKLAIALTYSIWLSCFLYFVIRYFALGTFLGGYTGSVGANQFSHIIEKWTDLGTLYRIVFPLNQAVFAGHEIYHTVLLLLYGALTVLIFARIIVSGIPNTWLTLLTIWALTALAPIYQLWGLGFNLEGSRFLFFLTIPLAILLPLLIFAPRNANSSPLNNLNLVDLKILAPGILALFSLVLLDAAIATRNNIPWIHAGKQIRALLQEGQRLALNLNTSTTGAKTKIIVLGIPKEIDGAHVIYNGLTFNFLMSPPFSSQDYSNKFINFDPILYGNANLINTSRFKQQIASSDTFGCYVWQPIKMCFEQLSLPSNKQTIDSNIHLSNTLSLISLPSEKNILLPFTWHRGSWQMHIDSLNITHCEKGTGLAVGPLAIDPFTYDFMEIEAAISPSANSQQLNVFWHNDYLNPEQNKNQANSLSIHPPLSATTNLSVDVPADARESTNIPANYQTYRIPLSRYWRWFTCQPIQGIWLEFPASESISIKNIRLLKDNSIVPKLEALELQADNTGVYTPDEKGITLNIDASQISNCTNVKLEFSKPNYFFDNFNSNSEQAVLSSININETSKKVFVSNNMLCAPEYYQIRAIGLTKEGNITGEWSDPLTIKR